MIMLCTKSKSYLPINILEKLASAESNGVAFSLFSLPLSSLHEKAPALHWRERKKGYLTQEGRLKHSMDKMKKNTHVSGVDIARKNDFEVLSHKALVSLLRMAFSTPSFNPLKKGKGDVQEVRAMHLFVKTLAGIT
jgi:hypothetical protein